MSQNNQNEEIDLMQLFGMIKEFFRKFLRLIVLVVAFYKKKWVLFLILSLIGGGIGFFMDQFQDKKDSYVQEIIIAPKYNSTEYVYDFIDDLEDNFKDTIFLRNLGLRPEQVESVKEFVLEPIIEPTDVLGELKETYEDKGSFVKEYDEKMLKEKKYRNFYQKHKLTISFTNRNADNHMVAKSVFEYIKSNNYFKNKLDLGLKQTEKNLQQNRKSMQFINEYLTNLSKNPSQVEDRYVFSYASESESPIISSLLERKEMLLETINTEEDHLLFEKEVITIVDYGNIISKRKNLIRRMLLIMPLLFIGLVSSVYLFKYLSREVNKFVNNE